MKKQLSFLLFQLVLSVFAFGKTITLEEALRQNWVSSTITRQSNPADDGRNFHLSLKNLTKEPLMVKIPVGFVFKAVDPNVQDFIHLENKELPVAALGTSMLFMKAKCICASRGCPSNGSAFLATTLAAPNLLALTTFALQQNLYNEGGMQYALWAISDNKDLVGIDNLPLAKFVAHLLNKPLPEYFVTYKQREVAAMTPQRAPEPSRSNRVQPQSQRQVVYEAAEEAIEPMAIKATFQYTLPTDQQVKLDLVDDKGKSVLAEYNMVETMLQTKGKHRFNFKLELTGVPRGTYFMKMTSTNDGKEWASMKVVF